MRAISLFSGVGGFEIGLERAGIQTVLQAEQDPWCLEVLARHWPDVERVDDVRKVDQAALQGRCRNVVSVGVGSDADRMGAARRRRVDTAGAGVDLVYGGFPCQDVSVAGNRAGLGGARSGLWSEFRRVLSELRPTWFCAENVPGLLSSNGGRDFGQILSDVDDLGYGVAWAVLDARWFGVPQRRRRVFIVGCLGNPDAAAAVLAVCESCGGHPATRRETGQGIAGSLAPGAHPSGFNGQDAYSGHLVAGAVAIPLTNRQGIGNPDVMNFILDGQNSSVVDELGSLHSHQLPMVAGALRASDGHHGHSSPRGDGADNLIAFDWMASGSERTRTVSPGDYARSNGTRNHTAISNAAGVRRLTPLECERLMAFPDDWTRWTSDGREIPDSHRYRMCGNGVVSTCAEWIGWRLMHVDRMLRGPV